VSPCPSPIILTITTASGLTEKAMLTALRQSLKPSELIYLSGSETRPSNGSPTTSSLGRASKCEQHGRQSSRGWTERHAGRGCLRFAASNDQGMYLSPHASRRHSPSQEEIEDGSRDDLRIGKLALVGAQVTIEILPRDEAA
jgi:hypothetical protein